MELHPAERTMVCPCQHDSSLTCPPFCLSTFPLFCQACFFFYLHYPKASAGPWCWWSTCPNTKWEKAAVNWNLVLCTQLCKMLPKYIVCFAVSLHENLSRVCLVNVVSLFCIMHCPGQHITQASCAEVWRNGFPRQVWEGHITKSVCTDIVEGKMGISCAGTKPLF